MSRIVPISTEQHSDEAGETWIGVLHLLEDFGVLKVS